MDKDRVKNQREPIAGKQVLYQGRLVDRDTFRAFVYDAEGTQVLAQNYDEYQKLVGSGIWFSTQAEAIKTLTEGQKELHENKERDAKEEIEKVKEAEKTKPEKVKPAK